MNQAIKTLAKNKKTIKMIAKKNWKKMKRRVDLDDSAR